jgi:hypothetical protein
MKVYESFEEIDRDIKKLDLERQIIVEELKLTKHQIKEDLAPLNWLDSIMKLFSKYGLSILLNRIFRKL